MLPFKEEENSEIIYPVEHISYSSISLLERCPRAFFFRYIKGISTTPNWKMITGSAFDETVNYHYEKKIATGADEPVSVLQDFVKEEFEGLKETCLWIPGQDKKKQQDKVLSACTKGIKTFSEKILEKVEPEGVQIEVLHEFTPGLKFKGYIDLIECGDRRIIVDNKTTWRKWTGTEKLWQLVAYSTLLNEQGIDIRETRYDVCVLKKRDDPVVSQFTDFISDRQRQFVLNKINWAAKFIAAGMKDTSLFNPNFSSWQCGAGCPNVDQCELESGMKLR
jgi:hypothetical protein